MLFLVQNMYISTSVLLAWMSLLLITEHCTGTHAQGPVPQYCQNEVFNVSCAPDEVIVMTSALYGRMRQGKCVGIDMGYIGCYSDVLDIADRQCSGKRMCTISVPNGDMDHSVIRDPLKPCPKDVRSYLEATYTCVKSLVSTSEECQNPVTVEVSPHSGVITSFLLSQTGCKNINAPWILEAMPGQTLNISIMDFHWTRKSTAASKLHYGDIIDLRTDEMISINGGAERTKHLYRSAGHKVQILFNLKVATKHSFIIKYNAMGCPDLIAPKDGWLQRKGTKLVIGCNGTRQSWHLHCKDVHWTGVIGNCTLSEAVMARRQQADDGPLNMPHGLAIFIVAAVSVCLSCTIILIGVICIRRFNRNAPLCDTPATLQTYKRYPRSADNNAHIQSGRLPKNDYMHIWDQPLPEPLVEEYQHPSDTQPSAADASQITNMKLIHEEMSRGLEKYMRTNETVGEDTRTPAAADDRVSSTPRTDARRKPELSHVFVPGRECENPDCICFVGYEPNCVAHSLSQ